MLGGYGDRTRPPWQAMALDRTIWNCAARYIVRYKSEAAPHVLREVERLTEDGDLESADTYKRIFIAIKLLEKTLPVCPER